MRAPHALVMSLVLALALGAARPAVADLGGNVTATYYLGGRPTGRSEVLLGLAVEGSMFEAFVDGAQFVLKVKAMIARLVARDFIGAGQSAYEAYGELRQMLDAIGDKNATGDATLALEVDATDYDEVRLTFTAWSDDDPLQTPAAVAPAVMEPRRLDPSAEKLGSRPAFVRTVPAAARGARRVVASIDIFPARLPLGRYALGFRAKEDDCGQCLAIVSAVTVSAARTRCPVVVGSTCQASLAWDRTEAEIAATQARIWAVAQRDRSWIRTWEAWERRWRTWRDRTCPPAPVGSPPRACDGEEPAPPAGACEQAIPAASPELCAALVPELNALDGALARRDALEQQIADGDCCQMSVNPTGAVGVPPSLDPGWLTKQGDGHHAPRGGHDAGGEHGHEGHHDHPGGPR